MQDCAYSEASVMRRVGSGFCPLSGSSNGHLDNFEILFSSSSEEGAAHTCESRLSASFVAMKSLDKALSSVNYSLTQLASNGAVSSTNPPFSAGSAGKPSLGTLKIGSSVLSSEQTRSEKSHILICKQVWCCWAVESSCALPTH
ncbi:hypothetical protein J3459_011283 [Metarhizium acridum]|nr:hypothetical protein J3459_011283 [Metarhizium acridum]